MDRTNTTKPDFEFVEKIATALDSKYHLPGTKFRFGLDPLIGLIPGFGDAVTLVIQGTLALYMIRFGASGKVAVKMLLNVFVDTLIGGIPIIGQIFDFFYKANTKNIKLLKEHYEEGKHQGSGWGIITIIFLGMLLFLALLVYAFYKLFVWIIQMF